MRCLLFLFLPLFSLAQNINIPDPVFKNFLIGSGVGYHLDTNGDGELSQQEALSVVNFRTFFGIGIGGVSNVTDFTGLEHFTNLQSVEILLNSATSLNLSNLPNLKKVRILGSNYGGVITNYSPILSLNVSRCTALQEVYLEFSNIQHLNLTTNTALKKFYARESRLETVNFSGLPLLERVEVFNGGTGQNFTFFGLLNTATFGGNTALNFVEIMNQPNLQVLDFTGATNLSKLRCYLSGLTTLNIQNLPNLKYVDCNNNHITELDLTGLINLETLYCNHNQIQTLDFTTTGNLTVAECNNNLLQELTVSPESNSKLIYVECNFNQLNALNFENLGSVFKGLECSNNLLEEIHVKGNDMRLLD